MSIEIEEYKQKLGNMLPQLDELAAGMGIEKLTAECNELEKQSQAPDFYSDPANMQTVLQKLKQVKNKIEGYNKLRSRAEDTLLLADMALAEGDDSLLEEIESEYKTCEADLEKLRLETLLSGEYDDSNAILTFHAGAGGTEAQDFKVSVLDYLDGDEAGLKSASIMISGYNAYGYLKSEHGVHRLVRVSPFDSSGRRHTSFASLEVMPEIDDNIDIEIRDEDIRVDTYRASGAGGQHVNKTESAIRITHIPTGIVVACQNERSQHQNRDVAMKMLKSKLFEIKQRENLERIEDIKGDQMQIAWGSQIRSYVFMPYTLAKDHRTGFENGNINAVMDGDLDGFINAYLKSII